MAFAADEPGVPGELGQSPSGQATWRAIGAIRSVAEHEVNDDEELLYLSFPDNDAARQAGLASLRRLDTRLGQVKRTCERRHHRLPGGLHRIA
jgi:hypothetical protein